MERESKFLMISYVAFLRGINVNGRKVVMGDLQHVFEELGFTQVKTLIASGNVFFASLENDREKLRKNIEEKLEKYFAFSIPVILRTREDVEDLVKQNPFYGISRSDEKGVRLQVTLFDHEITGEFPMHKNGFTMFLINKKALGSVVYPEGKTTELMTFIDKTFGKNATTRNWNTLVKIIKE